jgi:tRNA-2-methylthio-N6-dimethylallyladenosine synthase
MLSYYIETFGCQMNTADSDMLAGMLDERGYCRADSATDADLLVVNTCSVRKHAETRALTRISEYARLKKIKKKFRTLWVIGCMAERLGENLKKSVPGVDRVIGAIQLEYLSNNIDAYLQSGSEKAANTPGHEYGISAFLPVMRGCDNYCSYCVVPFVRGREKSIPAAEVVEKIRVMADSGTREITLLGQNVNSYRDGNTSFPMLLENIHEINGIERIRFTTSHPKDCSDELIKAVADLPKCCKHFHVPAQSGSSVILKAMNRCYNRNDYLELTERIRRVIPYADITTDLMTGFPGESEKDFEETMSLVRKVGFTTAFMFAYSPREETAAALLPGTVAETVSKERLARLIAEQTSITRNIYEQCIGKPAPVLFTERQTKRDRAWMGQDYGCKRVLLYCDKDLSGTILHVRIIKSSGMTLIAEKA